MNGRLGNQLFQYSFGLYLSKKWGMPFLLTFEKGRYPEIMKYFRLDQLVRIRTLLVHFFVKKRIQPEIVDLQDHVQYLLFLNRVENGTESPRPILLRGFFQSFHHPVLQRQILLKAFSYRRKVAPTFVADVVLHVRRGDYRTFGDPEHGGPDLRLPIEYYHRCVDYLGAGKLLKAVICDEVDDACRNGFPGDGGYVLKCGSILGDFEAMRRSTKLAISNSTFAWWAGFLGSAEVVCAPQNWLGFKVGREMPDGIQTARFHWVRVLAQELPHLSKDS